MDKFTNRVLAYIRENELIQRGDCVTVGFSGGADSVCLFMLLHELKRLLGISLQAVHVNHNLRGEEALRDESFCRAYAEALGEQFSAVSIDVRAYAGKTGMTEEEAGRVLRYEVLKEQADRFAESCSCTGGAGAADFANVANAANAANAAEAANAPEAAGAEGAGKASSDIDAGMINSGSSSMTSLGSGSIFRKKKKSLIAVAHHADDQAETVLMNLARGTGLKGLAGMRAKRDNIIRPLLGVSRADIVDYLGAHSIAYVDDSTNFENEHTRNRLRNIIIPALKTEVNAAASEHIALSAGFIREAEDYISSEAAAFAGSLGEVQTEGGIRKLKLNQSQLKQKARILRRYVIIEALGRLNIPLKDWGEKHFSDIDAALFKNKGHHVDLPGSVYAENAYRETYICVEDTDRA